MKRIPYTLKSTSARTQYYQLERKDKEYILVDLLRYQAFMGELSKLKDPTIKQIVDTYWYNNNECLPKGKSGYNSNQSFISGLINNMLFGNQYDLSDIQIEALTLISHDISQIYEGIDGSKYQPNMDKLLPYEFYQELFKFG